MAFQKGSFNRTKQITTSGNNKTYLFSDEQSLISLDALNRAFASPLIWWAGPLSSREKLEALVQNSYSFGLYVLPDSHNQERENDEGKKNGEMIGFARLITDYLTFAYLTDVYVLEEHQGLGLGRFMMECLHEVLAAWPDLRRGLLMTNEGSGAEELYRRVFGAYNIVERPAQEGVGRTIAMEWRYKKKDQGQGQQEQAEEKQTT